MGQKEIIIVRYGEVALKGMNKPYFERVLLGRIQHALKGVQGLDASRDDGLIVIAASEGESLPVPSDGLVKRVSKVFGVASVSPAIVIKSHEMAEISEAAIEFMRPLVKNRLDMPLTFKVKGKRSDKRFPIESPEMAGQIGAAILDAFGEAVKVRMKDPDVMLTVHLRRSGVFVYHEKTDGFGGLPLGTNGKGMVLLSGGIDSPVAAWLMAKRGMRLEAVHFHSYPYTSPRAQEKVARLASCVAAYAGAFDLHMVNLLPAQEAIVQHCPEALTTILIRRFMMRTAEALGIQTGCDVLITGESLGQVASQTAKALVVTDAVAHMPVMRPLIASDKTDIMDIAAEIGTYEISIEPFEDCCTVFLPKHPATRPKMEDVLAAETMIPDLEPLLVSLAASAEAQWIKPGGINA